MKDFFVFALILVNLGMLLYLYLQMRNQLKDKVGFSINLFAERLEERLKDLQEIKGYLIKLYATEEVTKLISEEVRKISAILLGRRSGQAGERAVEVLLSQFPPGLVVQNLRLSGGMVEFALKLKGEKYLPIDSKLPASEILAQEELQPQQEKEIWRRIKDRAKEITRYLQDERTTGFAIMAIPDGLYPYLQLRLFTELEREGIIPVPYQALPQTLMLLSFLWERLGHPYNQEALKEFFPALEGILANLERDLDQVQRELRSAFNLLDKSSNTLYRIKRTLANLREFD